MPPPAPLVALQGVTAGFGGQPLLQSIDLGIGRGDKLCLVGHNGSGKSTLMHLLAGTLQPDAGTRFLQPGIRVAHLAQDPSFAGHATVRSFVATGLPAGQSDDVFMVDAVLDRLSLAGDSAPSTLSGGEARRAALAQALVGTPDVLLLDEPTNHLDLPTIEWLEEHLTGFRGGLLVISHDRAFLKRLGRGTLWLDRGRLRVSERPFAEFEAWQTEVFAAEEEEAHKLDRKIASELKWLREGLSARRRRNMGRVRALQTLRESRRLRIAGGAKVKLAITEAETGGKLAIEAVDVAKAFGAGEDRRRLVSGFSTRILRGDRVGIIGRNGAGKTTLVRLLTGTLAPDAGKIRHGTELAIAYFDQRRAALDPEDTVQHVLCPHGGDRIETGGRSRHVTSYLRDFLFDPSRLDSPVRTLSGGERNRLLLARLFAAPSNLLVLDEPTNDLDMDTLDLLEDVLADYDGTLLLVSHDRDFLDRLVTSTIVLEGDGRAVDYAGGYLDYLAQRPNPPPPAPTSRPVAKAIGARRDTAGGPAVRKLSYKQQRELDQLPAQIQALETEINWLEAELTDPDLYRRNPGRFQAVTETLDARRAALGTAEDRWLELESLREALESAS